MRSELILPEHLSGKKERLLLSRCERQQDPKAREILIRRNLRLVMYIALQYKNYKELETEELFSEGAIGLIRAVDSFSLSRGVRFSTYASACIHNQIRMFLRREMCFRRRIFSGDRLAGRPDPYMEAAEHMEEYTVLRSAYEKLPEREKRVLALRYGLRGNRTCLTQRETACRLHVSQSYISRLERRSCAHLRALLEEKKGR